KLFIGTISVKNLEFLNLLFKRFSNTINRMGDNFLIDLFKKSLLSGDFDIINILTKKLPKNIKIEDLIDSELIFDIMKLGLIEIVDYLFEKLTQNQINEIINLELIVDLMKVGLDAIYLLDKLPQDTIWEI